MVRNITVRPTRNASNTSAAVPGATTSAAAEAMRIHPNTFRYRLKRAVQLTGIDLEDHVERLMVGLLLEING